MRIQTTQSEMAGNTMVMTVSQLPLVTGLT